MNERERKEEMARLLLETKAVTIDTENPYRYTSGILSPIYCNNRRLLFHPIERNRIMAALIAVARTLCFDIIAGVATAGIPWGAILADRLEEPFVYVRKQAKEHGEKKQIEGGIVEENQGALVVEDLVSTARSVVTTSIALRSAGAVVTNCLAIFTYQMGEAGKLLQAHDMELHTLTDFSTLINVAVREGYITEAEEKIVLEWHKNPRNWGNSQLKIKSFFEAYQSIT